MADVSEVENGAVAVDAAAAEEVEGADGDTVKVPVAVEDPYKKAISYLEEHHIIQIFQVLTTGIVCDRPTDPLDYMIEQVEHLRKEEKFQVKKPDEF